MNQLPVVRRELREAARRPSTAALRLTVALAAIAVSLAILASGSIPPGLKGRSLLTAQVVLAAAFCLLTGCLATAAFHQPRTA